LLTTRSAEVAEVVAESDVVELNDMDSQEASDPLRKSVRREVVVSDNKATTEILAINLRQSSFSETLF
jgi:hypothetical protein